VIATVLPLLHRDGQIIKLQNFSFLDKVLSISWRFLTGDIRFKSYDYFLCQSIGAPSRSVDSPFSLPSSCFFRSVGFFRFLSAVSVHWVSLLPSGSTPRMFYNCSFFSTLSACAAWFGFPLYFDQPEYLFFHFRTQGFVMRIGRQSFVAMHLLFVHELDSFTFGPPYAIALFSGPTNCLGLFPIFSAWWFCLPLSHRTSVWYVFEPTLYVLEFLP